MDQVPDRTPPAAGEQVDEQAHEPVPTSLSAPEIESTGDDVVDRVLADVAAVANAPVADHVQVFERAHEQLRRALDAQPEPATDGEQGA